MKTTAIRTNKSTALHKLQENADWKAIYFEPKQMFAEKNAR